MTSLSKPYLLASPGTLQFREAAVLTYAVETVFRKLIRILIGKISLKRLEASKSVVVDKANNRVRMNENRYMPFESEDQTENTKMGMAMI